MLTLDTTLARPYAGEDALTEATSHALQELLSLLRKEGPGADMLGWLDLPLLPRAVLEKIVDRAKRIQDENDCLVVIGIGGSYLGARAAIQALPSEASFPVIFAGINLSPTSYSDLLAGLENKRFALCVISKSGGTLEPAIAFRLLRKKLVERLGESLSRKRIIAITDPSSGTLRSMAAKEGYETFPIPKGVGGRFSVLSESGLFPCAAAGLPVAGMIEGARAALGRFTRGDASNEALRYAAVRNLLHLRGTAIEILSTFHPELASFSDWWKQLAAESEGKNGRGLFPASALMSTDLHSLGQYLQEGPRFLLETFLSAAGPRADITIPFDEEDSDGLNYLAGRRLSEVNRKAFEGTREAHASGGIPVLTIETESITPDALGELFVFFEISIAISGRLLGVNPFNQPGVEEYKRRVCKLLGKP